MENTSVRRNSFWGELRAILHNSQPSEIDFLWFFDNGGFEMIYNQDTTESVMNYIHDINPNNDLLIITEWLNAMITHAKSKIFETIYPETVDEKTLSAFFIEFTKLSITQKNIETTSCYKKISQNYYIGISIDSSSNIDDFLFSEISDEYAAFCIWKRI